MSEIWILSPGGDSSCELVAPLSGLWKFRWWLPEHRFATKRNGFDAVKTYFKMVSTYFTHFNFSHFVFDCFRKESACRADSGRVGLGKRPHAWAKDKQLPSGTDSLSELSDARRSLDHSESVLSSLCSLKNTHPQHDSDYRSLSVFSLTHCSRKLQWQE